jgi:hypothetical protein
MRWLNSSHAVALRPVNFLVFFSASQLSKQSASECNQVRVACAMIGRGRGCELIEQASSSFIHCTASKQVQANETACHETTNNTRSHCVSSHGHATRMHSASRTLCPAAESAMMTSMCRVCVSSTCFLTPACLLACLLTALLP